VPEKGEVQMEKEEGVGRAIRLGLFLSQAILCVGDKKGRVRAGKGEGKVNGR